MEFIQARNYTPANRTSIDVIVVHTMETPQDAGRARKCAQWFAGSTAPRASAHYCVDDKEVVQCVRDKDVAWHAPGANTDGIGIEHAGSARQTASQWGDPYAKAQLEVSAKLTAGLVSKYGIPLVWLSIEDLKANRRGITSHNNVSQAFHQSTHWDPGPNFPSARYIDLVKKAMGGAGGEPVPTGGPKTHASTPPTIRQGAEGWPVGKAQRMLNACGQKIEVDGSFGPATLAAVKEIQSGAGIAVDGVIGPDTWKALKKGAREAPKEPTKDEPLKVPK